MSSKMEQIIEEIEEYIDGCKFQPLSSTKIIVNKEELEELIAELRAKTPEEVKRYQKIISNKEAILADAQAKADQIIAQAQVQTNELVSEHQIMQQAYAQANEVVTGHSCFHRQKQQRRQPLLPDRQQSLQRSRRLPIFQLQMRMPRKSKGIQHPTVNSKRIIFCNT